MIGTAKLQARAKLVKENKEFAEKIISIKRLEIEEKEQSKSHMKNGFEGPYLLLSERAFEGFYEM